jgi:glutathione S-transferase
MKLYHVPGSRSARVLWLLLELDVPCEVVTLSLADGSLRAPGYRALNPLGRVPTLEDEGVSFYESGAIVQYLLERYGGGRLEPEVASPDRPVFLQWLHWGEATLMPPIVTINSHRFVLPEADRSPRAVDVARRQLTKIVGVLESEVRERSYLVGNAFSAADIVVACGVTLAKLVGELPDTASETVRWLDGLALRASYQRAFDGGFGGQT